MNKISKLLMFAVIATSLTIAGCTKPPVQEMDNAKAAMKAAQDSGAEVCADTEYQKAKNAVDSAEAKMAEAEKGGDKGELYKEAKAELVQAVADFEKAKQVAQERAQVNEKAKAELETAKKNLSANAEDGMKYSATYKDAQAKIDEAQALIDKCEGEKALEVLKQINSENDAIQKEVVDGKAAAMKAEASTAANGGAVQTANSDASKAAVAKTMEELARYTVVKGDNLWNISKAKYLNPFMWPLIYWSNKEQIKDPDLIFPGQVFKIRKAVDNDKSKAVDYAKHRGPWSLFDGK